MTEHDERADESLHESLVRAREEIARLDRAIVGLLAERLERSRRVGRLKRAAGLPVHDPAREAEVIRSASAAAREHGLPDDPVRDLFWQIISLSRATQEESG